MEENNQEKLNRIIKLRKDKLNSLFNFYENFEIFAFIHLKEVVKSINNELEISTNENLKVFSDNPYEMNTSRFFVMVQLFIGNNKRTNFLLDNSESYPLLKFEGDEYTGKIKSTITYGNKVNQTTEYSVNELNNKDKVFEIVLNFLNVIYNL